MGRYSYLVEQQQKKPAKQQAPAQPEIPAPSSESAHQPAAPGARPLPERANARTPERGAGKRIITRQSFELFEDQKESLRTLALKELATTGKIGSMSAMVRDAIDAYIKTKTNDHEL